MLQDCRGAGYHYLTWLPQKGGESLGGAGWNSQI